MFGERERLWRLMEGLNFLDLRKCLKSHYGVNAMFFDHMRSRPRFGRRILAQHELGRDFMPNSWIRDCCELAQQGLLASTEGRRLGRKTTSLVLVDLCREAGIARTKVSMLQHQLYRSQKS